MSHLIRSIVLLGSCALLTSTALAQPVGPASASSPGSVTLATPNAPTAEQLAAAFGWLPQLAGSCWRAKLDNAGATDTECFSWDYNLFLRASSEILGPPGADGKRPVLRGSSVMASARARNILVMVFWLNTGAFGSLEGRLDAGAPRFDDPRAPNGTQRRSSWIRASADSYDVVREQKEGETWRELGRLTYTRVPRPAARK